MCGMKESACDILHVIATSPWPATADALVGQLAKADGRRLCVIDNGCDAPAADMLRGMADEIVDARGTRKVFTSFGLRRLVGRIRPARVQTWGREALAVAATAAGGRPIHATIIDLAPGRRQRYTAWGTIIQRAEKIDCGDEAIAQALCDLVGNRAKMHVLPPLRVEPVDLPNKREAKERLNLPMDQPVVLMAGPWPRRSVTEPTVWAVGFIGRIWPGLRLLMVADGRLSSYIHHSAASNDLADAPMPLAAEGTRLPLDALAAADVFLSAPHRIGPSLALAEAAAAGLPLVVGSTASSHSQLVDASDVQFSGPPLPIRLASALQQRLSACKEYRI